MLVHGSRVHLNCGSKRIFEACDLAVFLRNLCSNEEGLNGIRTQTSAIPVQCSTRWVIRPVGSCSLCGSIISPKMLNFHRFVFLFVWGLAKAELRQTSPDFILPVDGILKGRLHGNFPSFLVITGWKTTLTAWLKRNIFPRKPKREYQMNFFLFSHEKLSLWIFWGNYIAGNFSSFNPVQSSPSCAVDDENRIQCINKVHVKETLVLVFVSIDFIKRLNPTGVSHRWHGAIPSSFRAAAKCCSYYYFSVKSFSF